MVVGDLPFTIFKDVDIRVSGLDLVSSSSHGEFIDTDILAPVLSGGDIGFQDLSLWLLGKEVNKVRVDSVVVRAGFIRDSWEKNSVLGVTLGNLIGVKSGKGVVPQVKERAAFFISDGLASWGFGHLGGVVVGNLPFSVFKDVNKRVTGTDLVSSGTHGKVVDTDILAPVLTGHGVGLDNLSLGLHLEEVGEVVMDSIVVSAWSVRDSWEKNSVLGVTLGDSVGVKSGKSVVPQVEELLGFRFRDGLSLGGFRHDRRVVVGNLPLSVFVDVDIGVTGLDLVSTGTHGEFVDTGILAPSGSDLDLSINDLSLGLQLKKVGEVVLKSGVVSAWLIRDSGEKDGVTGVTVSNLLGVKSGKGVVPDIEQLADLILRDVFGEVSLDGRREKVHKAAVSNSGGSSGSKASGVGGLEDLGSQSRRSATEKHIVYLDCGCCGYAWKLFLKL
mmetsp:Transcript_36560/g.88599  ORF Transcript_36560/g.88599 Transcript_36560/m.88599 type:complete len:443 (+) Transcript_36560:425-1753(+)